MSRFTNVYNKLHTYAMCDSYKSVRFALGFVYGGFQIASIDDAGFKYGKPHKIAAAGGIGLLYGVGTSIHLPVFATVQIVLNGADAYSEYNARKRLTNEIVQNIK